MNPRRVAMGLSAALHIGVVVVAAVGLPQLPVRVLDDSPPIEVEMVRVAEQTTPKPPEPKIEPKPQPVAEAPKPEPPKPEPPKAEAPKPEPARQPPPEPAPTPKAKPAEAAAPPPVPLAKPKPPPEKEKEDNKSFDPGRIFALLNKMQKPSAPTPAPATAPAPAPAPPSPAITLQAPLTVSEIDVIRQQFYHCWSVPAGARDAADLVVRVRVSLNPDGSLRAPPELVDRSRINDTFWLAAAESALRAVRKCEPLKNLPPGKYERWRDIELTFNPKDMLG